MAKSLNSVDPNIKPKQTNPVDKSWKTLNLMGIPACEKSGTAAIIDVILLVAVIGSCGFLLFPYAKILFQQTTWLTMEVTEIVVEEIGNAPMIFGCLALSILFAGTALVVVILYADPRCGKSNCRGLKRAAEFDIQIETEDSMKKQNNVIVKASVKKGLFQLRRGHHKVLEAELKKMAPPNGKAVLIHRAKCGCCIGRMEVPGPR
ncbi:hypothetical protein M569_03337, partial [Genlisea aurea]